MLTPDEAQAEIREVPSQMGDCPLRQWALREAHFALGLPPLAHEVEMAWRTRCGVSSGGGAA